MVDLVSPESQWQNHDLQAIFDAVFNIRDLFFKSIGPNPVNYDVTLRADDALLTVLKVP